MEQKGELLAEKTGVPKVRLWFTRNAKLLVVCFAVGMVCHAQMYLNGLSNPDAVVSLSNPNGYGSFIPHAWDMSLGRWGLLFAAYAKFGLCSSILTSAITIVLFTLGIVALIDKLGIRNACLRYASSVLFIASPFVSCCITYYYCSNSYALSFLCAVLAACLIGRVGSVGKPVALVGAVALLAFSLGCYQASLGVFCVAVLLVMIRALMGDGSEPLASLACDARGAEGRLSCREESRGVEVQSPCCEEGCSASSSFSAKQLAVFFGVAVVVCAAGAVLYYALTELSLFVLGIGLSSYGGASSVGAGSILGSLTSSIPSAYVAFSDGLFGHDIFGNHFGWVYVAAVGLIVAAVAFARLVAINGVKRLGSSAMALLCVVLIPFAANVILVIVPSYGYPTPLMLGGFMASFLLLPLLVQLLLDSSERGNARLRVPAKAMSVGCCCLVAVGGVVVRSTVECGCRGYADMPKPNCFFGYPNCWRARRESRCAGGCEVADCRKARGGKLSKHQRFLCSRKQLCEVGYGLGQPLPEQHAFLGCDNEAVCGAELQLLLVRRMCQGYSLQ